MTTPILDRTERDKEIRRLRRGKNRKTLFELSEIYNLTPERIRQIEGRVSVDERRALREKRYLQIYKFQERYQGKYQRYATISEVVRAGFAADSRTLRYYYKKMVEAGMMQIDRGIARGIRLLPLKGMEPETVQETEEA